MTTIQLTMDETLAEAIRKKALETGQTLEAWLVDVATKQVAPPDKAWIDRLLDHAEKHPGNSGGARWTRDELHNR